MNFVIVLLQTDGARDIYFGGLINALTFSVVRRVLGQCL